MNKIITFMRDSQTSRFFIPAGLLLIIVGIIAFVITLNNQSYIKTEATVINVEKKQESTVVDGENQITTVYNATLNYKVDEKEYTQNLDDVSKCSVGDKMTIYYNPDNPSQITQSKNLVFPIIIIVGGIAFLTGGIISAVNAVKKHKKMKEQERSWANNE